MAGNQKGGTPKSRDGGLSEERLPTLIELLIGFQKSMARVAQMSARAAVEDPLYLYGRRKLYQIDEIEVELPVRIRPALENVLGVDFYNRLQVITSPEQGGKGSGDSKDWGLLRFKVQGRTLAEQLNSAYVFVNLVGFNKEKGSHQYEIMIIALDEKGNPIKEKKVSVSVSSLVKGVARETREIKAYTDERGKLAFKIITAANSSRKKFGAKAVVLPDQGEITLAEARIYEIKAEIAEATQSSDRDSSMPQPKAPCYRSLVIDRSLFEGERITPDFF